MLSIPILQMPTSEFSIDDCEEAIIWTTATKEEVLRAIRDDEQAVIYFNLSSGPKWIIGQMTYESTVIDVADQDLIENVEAARGSTDFIAGIPPSAKSIVIILSHISHINPDEQ